MVVVAPARERGLKFQKLWPYGFNTVVAPARERGLKLMTAVFGLLLAGRSREGAWIEMSKVVL